MIPKTLHNESIVERSPNLYITYVFTYRIIVVYLIMCSVTYSTFCVNIEVKLGRNFDTRAAPPPCDVHNPLLVRLVSLTELKQSMAFKLCKFVAFLYLCSQFKLQQ